MCSVLWYVDATVARRERKRDGSGLLVVARCSNEYGTLHIMYISILARFSSRSPKYGEPTALQLSYAYFIIVHLKGTTNSISQT